MGSIMAGAFCACTPESPPLDPQKIVNSGKPVDVNIKELSNSEQADFRRAYLNTSFDLLRLNSENNNNVMISPASIMIALSMVEAGANGRTAEQMAALWGGEDDRDAQLSYAAYILNRLNESEGAPKLDTFIRIANALGVSADALLQDGVEHANDSIMAELSVRIGRLPQKEQNRILNAIRALTE